MQDYKKLKRLTNLQKKARRKQGLCQRKQELSQYRMSKLPATKPVQSYKNDCSQDGRIPIHEDSTMNTR